MSYCRLYADGALVHVDNTLDDAQSDASARLMVGVYARLVLRLEEGLEDTRQVFLPYAYAVVAHLDDELIIVGIGCAAQFNAALCKLVGIGKQVADDLGDALAVDDGSKALRRIDSGELFSALFEGWFKAFANGVEQLIDVVRCEVHDETMLLYLAEVEQLVDKLKQSVGIAVNDVKLLVVDGILQFLQWSDYQRYWCAYLVSHHCEERQSRFAVLFLLLFVHALQLKQVFLLGSLQFHVDIIPNGTNDNQQVKHLGPPTPPEWRFHHDGEGCLIR